jgi:DNA repair protein RecO (recombination protein O)
MLNSTKATQLKATQTSNQQVYVLHTYPFKETSLVVELFSQQFGRVAAVAKGARRPRSAMRGMLQSFQLLNGTWSGKNELKTLHSLDWSEGLTLMKGEALMCGFYLNELLLRLLPREDAHEDLFAYYAAALTELAQVKPQASGAELAIILRKFELKLLQEMGYAVPLTEDEQGEAIVPDKYYRYEAEYGACDLRATKNGVQLLGATLLNMASNDYTTTQTQQQSKQLMRYLLQHYLGDKPLHTRQLLIDLQGI